MITLIGGDLYQWDTGRYVLVVPDKGSVTHEVHYSTGKMDYAYVVKTYEKDGGTYCAIPNILLQQYRDIYCYEVQENENGEETVTTTVFSVTRRNRPVNYVYTEPEKYTYKDLENRIEKLEEAIELFETAGGIGEKGEDGGYYIPTVSQSDKTTMTVSYVASDEEMPEVETVTITLPAGQDGYTPVRGVDYWTDEDQESIVDAAVAKVEADFSSSVDTIIEF